MTDLVIHARSARTNDICALCGAPAAYGAGPQLFHGDRPGLVCRECGKKHAPSLVALLDLAGAAERAGKIGRHTLTLPLTTLLDLARAAEDYTCAAPQSRWRAA